jgi:hypothetical protein
MDEKLKKNIHNIEIIGAVILLLISVASFFPKPGITGFVSVETKKQLIDLTIANPQSYILTTENEVPFYLTSLKFSGEVIGEGIVEAYLDNNQGQKVLIYSNVQAKDGGLNTVTGMDKVTGQVVGDDEPYEGDTLVIEHLENLGPFNQTLAPNEFTTTGTFENQCAHTCFTEILLQKDIAYQLLFYVEEGTILKLNEITYTIRKD